jgi:hypothetical protein
MSLFAEADARLVLASQVQGHGRVPWIASSKPLPRTKVAAYRCILGLAD